MTLRYFIPLALAGALSLNSCMTSSEKWVDDDVYVMKSSEVPTDTDITDETDYNAWKFNRNHTRNTVAYSSTFFFRPTFQPYWMMYPSYAYGGYYNHGYGSYGWGSPWYTDYYGFNGMYGYDPYWGYNPYYGYNPYFAYNPYGYNPYYGYPGYGGNGGSTAHSRVFVQGPRGTTGSGFGGVRSRSDVAYKFTPTTPPQPSHRPVSSSVAVVSASGKTVSKPVTTYENVGRHAGGTPTVTRPTNPGATTYNSGSSARPGRAGSDVPTVSRPPRPASTTNPRNVYGTSTASPRVNGGDGGTYTNPGRSSGNSGTISTPSRSSGSSGSSGSSSGSSGGSSRSGSSGSSGSSSRPGRN